jgi:hypothetical protein
LPGSVGTGSSSFLPVCSWRQSHLCSPPSLQEELSPACSPCPG